jgi:hypothetical protein
VTKTAAADRDGGPHNKIYTLLVQDPYELDRARGCEMGNGNHRAMFVLSVVVAGFLGFYVVSYFVKASQNRAMAREALAEIIQGEIEASAEKELDSP